MKRTTLSKARTQKRTVAKGRRGTHVALEHLEDVPEALGPDDLRHDLQHLLRRLCGEDGPPEAP